jgi:acetolactate synthase-1/2/3 large subunit
MKGSRALLEMFKGYHVDYVFGLPGETTLPLYVEWVDFPDVKHVMFRDERSACFAADAYARVSFKPGICESPSVGSTHIIPAIAEAYYSSTPIIALTTDVPLHLHKKNMLTAIDQTSLFKGITKETMTITKAIEIPHVVRRAFRLATTGKPGPVHVRIPSDILEEEVPESDIYVQEDFAKYPGHRFTAELEKVKKAIELLYQAEKPLIICGQGSLYSQAWDELVELAELLGIPVGSTMAGKGCFPENHPLSIGVVGSRGGTSFSNRVLRESDLIFYIGCNTDYTTTDAWTLPSPLEGKIIIHLDISEAEVGNNYPTQVSLIGDAKATLRLMLNMINKNLKRNWREIPRIRELINSTREFWEELKTHMDSTGKPVNPIKFIKSLSENIPQNHVLIADPGVSAIYLSAFYRVKKPGRTVLFNYSLGALGFAIPASIGAHFARPESHIIALTGDGSFGFTAGELETISRVGGKITIILFNNQSFGWIRASIYFKYGPKYFATEFKPIDYMKIAEGFGLLPFRVESSEDLDKTLSKAFNTDTPTFIEIIVEPEDKFVSPVPSWVKKAKELGLRYIY